MRILGIDPGYAIVGYGIIDFYNGKYISNDYGAVFTSADDEFSHRLEIIFDSLNDIIVKYKPEVMSIEKLYFQNNQKTAIDVSQARGVIILAAQKNKLPIYEYTPLQVKTAVTGYGKAQKFQVMSMIKRLLRLKELPKPDDTADALAIAICHANSLGRQYVIDKIINK